MAKTAFSFTQLSQAVQARLGACKRLWRCATSFATCSQAPRKRKSALAQGSQAQRQRQVLLLESEKPNPQAEHIILYFPAPSPNYNPKPRHELGLERRAAKPVQQPSQAQHPTRSRQQKLWSQRKTFGGVTKSIVP